MLDLHAATWTEKDRYEIRPDARRFEMWEANMSAKIGLGVAVDYALQWDLEAIWARVQTLAEALRDQLRALDGITVHDLGRVRCGIVTFSALALPAEEIKTRLRAKNINVSVSPPSSTRLDAKARDLPDLVRASVHYYNTEKEIDRFCEALHACLS